MARLDTHFSTPVAAVPATVSVVVTCYNSARFVREALLSAVAQTRPPLEIVVVDDGSTDDTEAAVRSVEDSRIRYVRQENGGVSAARNRGLEEVRGDFVAFLDGDDRWRPQLLAIEAAVLEAEPRAACVFADFVRFEHYSGRILGRQFPFVPELDAMPTRPGPQPNTFAIEGDAFCELIRCHDIPSFSPVMLYRRAVADAVRFDPRLNVCEDMAFFLRVLMHGGTAVFSRDILAEVRRHGTNLTADYSRIPFHKVEALRLIEPHIPHGPRRNAFQSRLVRALIDIACLSFAWGDTERALRACGEALTVPGSWRRKLRAIPRMVRLWSRGRRSRRRRSAGRPA